MNLSMLKKRARSVESGPAELATLATYGSDLAYLVAENPSATADVLRTLCEHPSAGIRKLVASHPNTSFDVLMSLAVEFPREFLANPNAEAFLTENPDIVEHMDIRKVRSLAKNTGTLTTFILLAAHLEDEGVQLNITQNRSAPWMSILYLQFLGVTQKVCDAANAWSTPEPTGEEAEHQFWNKVGERIVNLKKDHSIRNLFDVLMYEQKLARPDKRMTWVDDIWQAANPKLDDEAMLMLAQQGNPWVHEELLQREVISEAVAVALADTQTVRLRKMLAERKDMYPSVLSNLPDERFLAVTVAVAGNPNTPTATLDHLLNVVNHFVMERIAQNPNASSNALYRLAKESHFEQSIAGNPAAPLSLLNTLAHQKDETLREAIAKNTKRSEYPRSMLWLLARKGLAKNSKAPAELLRRLAQSNEESVIFNVALNPRTPANILSAMAKDESADIRYGVATNPHTPIDVLDVLSQDTVTPHYSHTIFYDYPTMFHLYFQFPQDSICCGVMKNPATPVSILKRNMNYKYQAIRYAIAENPSLPMSYLEKLAHSDEVGIRYSVAKNPSTPLPLLYVLAESMDEDILFGLAQNPNLPAETLEMFAKKKLPALRQAVANNPNTPASVLRYIARFRFEGTLPFLASNPNTPPDIWERLLKNKHLSIIEGCAANPNYIDQILIDIPQRFPWEIEESGK